MKFFLKASPFSALLLLAGCTYMPEEVSFTEVPIPENVYSISLNDYDEADTIFLYGEANFSYRASTSPGDILNMYVTLDEASLGGDSQAGTFSIKNEHLKTGIHELKIMFRATSGSGSLADLSGREQFQVWRTWTVKIDVDPPPKPTITQTVENGFVKL